jgi:hypothetical protein
MQWMSPHLHAQCFVVPNWHMVQSMRSPKNQWPALRIDPVSAGIWSPSSPLGGARDLTVMEGGAFASSRRRADHVVNVQAALRGNRTRVPQRCGRGTSRPQNRMNRYELAVSVHPNLVRSQEDEEPCTALPFRRSSNVFRSIRLQRTGQSAAAGCACVSASVHISDASVDA